MSARELELARGALARGDAESARSAAQAACKSDPGSAEAWFLLGAAHHRAGDPAAALSAFERAASILPTAPGIANARASLLSELGRDGEAVAVLEAVLAKGPERDPQLLVNLAIAQEAVGADGPAERRYREAVDVAMTAKHPAILPALQNLGALLMRLQRHAEALPIHRDLVTLVPGMADAHFNLAENLLALGDPEAALHAADTALRIDPRHVFARIDRAFALALADRLLDAQAELERARATDPTQFASYRNAYDPDGKETLEGVDARVLYVQWHYRRLELCDWSRRDAFLTGLRSLLHSHEGWSGPLGDASVAFRAFALPISGTQMAALAGSVAREVETIDPVPPRVRPGTRSRLRIGYVSPDFRVHPTAHLTRALYPAHDRDRFEVFAYSLFPGPDDDLTRAIEAGCDIFRRVSAESTRTIVERIRDDGIDILVDLAGYTTHSRPGVFRARAAPVQASWLVYPWTTGSDAIDYALVDATVVPPGGDTLWSERLVRLPGTYFFASPAAMVATPSRAELELPERGFVFCCFNNAWKIEPEVFTLWMRMLREVPGSVLWLLALSEPQVAHLRAAAAARGVDPGRLVFARFRPHEQHLARYRAADLFVDTLVCNAHTTAVDALWAGLPVLTCPGEIMPSRVAASLLRSLGLDALIADNPESYVTAAVRLAREPSALAALRSRLASARAGHRLFDPAGTARLLEGVYARMWQRHGDGLPPAAFDA